MTASMIGLDALSLLLAKHGLAVLAPAALIEGPIVTVIAAWLASRGLFDVWSVAAVVIAADLLGDFAFYALGRGGLARLPLRWRTRLGLNADRLARLAGHFEVKGGRTLLLGKLTHSFGFAVLVAAGAARMPLLTFFWFNLLGTVPKSLAFVGIGYGFGAAYARIDDWIARASLAVLAVALLAGVTWLITRGARR